jgi:hypothetical protein
MGLNTQSFNIDRVVRRMMLFIDGGYLRKYLKDMFRDDNLNYPLFINSIREQLSTPSLFFRASQDILL